jgi:hypothetical protein
MSFGLSEDDALKQRLRGIYVQDEKNANREVGVWYANPDVETRTQSYPYMVVELIDYTRAQYRQQSGLIVDSDVQGTVAPIAGVSHVYEVPVPWDLTYQITAYSRHPRHDRAITAYILNNVFIGQHGYLAVTNDLGTETGYRHMVLEEFTKRDTVESGRRLFRTVFTVTVSSEGTAYGPTSTTEVSSVLINQTTSGIPADKQPI